MERFAGFGSWLGYCSLLFSGIALGSYGTFACSSDGTSGGGSAGATATAGSGGMVAASGAAGATTAAGAGGTGANAGSHSGGSGTAGGAHAGASGGSSTDTEIAVSLLACKPTCPAHQYCALLGPECTTEPCLVHAVCRDRPPCSASLACPALPQNTCRDDPSDSCSPATGMTCPGRCYCTEGNPPCGEQDLDRRPDVCKCVTPGPATDCLGVVCPGNDECDVVLGKLYCVSP